MTQESATQVFKYTCSEDFVSTHTSTAVSVTQELVTQDFKHTGRLTSHT